MRYQNATDHDTAISQINVTPLVDVMLCLLIIFMIAAPTLTRRLSLDLPQLTPPDRIQNKPEPPLQLRILADGRLLLDDVPIADDVLAAELAVQAQRDARRVLAIDVDRAAQYQRVVDMLASAKVQGIARIAML